MLRVDLAELIREPGRNIEHEFDDRPPNDDDIEYLSNVVGGVTISNAGSLVVVRGMFKTTIRMECGRCLGEVTVPVEAEIDEQYTLSDVIGGGHESGLTLVGDEENELPPNLMLGTVMDLGVLVRQSMILASPLSVLCKDDCKGLCPNCGKNKNLDENGCTCENSMHNTPLAALKQLYDLNDSDGPEVVN